MTKILEFRKKEKFINRDEFQKRFEDLIQLIESEWNYHIEHQTINKYCQDHFAHSKWRVNFLDLNLISDLEQKMKLTFKLSKKEELLIEGELEGFGYNLTAATEVELRLINLILNHKYNTLYKK